MNEMDNKEEKKIIRQEFLTGERALFMGKISIYMIRYLTTASLRLRRAAA